MHNTKLTTAVYHKELLQVSRPKLQKCTLDRFCLL